VTSRSTRPIARKADKASRSNRRARRPSRSSLSGANVHDKWMVGAILDACMFRGARGPRRPVHLCLDKGYDFRDTEAAIRTRRIVPHIRRVAVARSS
jgi:hypothetical protein